MVERRDELLRIREDADLDTDEDEELAALTERLLKFGYLENSEADGVEDALDDDDDESDDEEEAEALSDEDDESEEEEAEEELGEDVVAAGDAGRGGRPARGARHAEDLALDDIVSQAQRGGAQDMRNMGVFQMASPGVAGAGEDEGEGDGGPRYPEPPARAYRLPELLRLAGLEEQAGDAPDLQVSGILTCNSVSPAEGALYVCVPSADGQHDGHDWADEAAELGAVAVLAERPLPDALLPVVVVPDTLRALGQLAAAFYEQPSQRTKTLGVVGSFGKTTTCWLARGMFEETNERVGMIGTIEYALAEDRLTEEGDIWAPDAEDVTMQRDCSSPFHITPYEGKYPEVPSTPDALHLQKVLAGCADRGAERTLVEIDPSELQDGRLDAVDFEVLLYTNTFPDGEAAAGGRQAYQDSVEPLFTRRRPAGAEPLKAIINVDDAFGEQLRQAAEAAGNTVLTYSLDSRAADVFAEKVKTSIWETEVLVNTPLGRLQIITPLLGRAAAYNVVAAVSAGIACGVPLRAIVAGIEAVDIIPGRCEIIDEGQQFAVVVDSADTPEQLSRLLDEVKDAGAKRVLLVFGCTGTTTAEERAAMLQMAHFKADAVYVTNDSPGTEWPNDIIADMVAGLPDDVLNKYASSSYPWLQDPHRIPQWYQKYMLQYQSSVGVHVIEDRFQAIRVAIGMAKPREVVIVAGKGHVDYQEYWDGASMDSPDTLKSWFDDRVECRNALSKLSYLNGIKELDRNALPWTRYPEERDVLIIEGVVDTPVVPDY